MNVIAPHHSQSIQQQKNVSAQEKDNSLTDNVNAPLVNQFGTLKNVSHVHQVPILTQMKTNAITVQMALFEMPQPIFVAQPTYDKTMMINL